MHQLAIVDNQPDQIGIIKHMISCFPKKGCFATTCFSSASEFVFYLEEGGHVDILMMDIKLDSDDSGIDIVQKYFPPNCGTQIIYITGFIEYCIRVYRTDHTYFLVKPVAQEDFDDALNKALHNLVSSDCRPICIQSGSSVLSVLPKRIQFIESNKRKIRVHTGGDPIEAYASLSDISASLPSQFTRCHKSFLVNMDYISELKKDRILMLSGEVIPVSQRSRGAVKQAFLTYLQDA